MRLNATPRVFEPERAYDDGTHTSMEVGRGAPLYFL